MSSMEKLNEAIIEKVKAEAREIIKGAEEKAWQGIEKAEKQREVRLREEERRCLEGAEGEAARILARASISARQELQEAKDEVIGDIVYRVKTTLSNLSRDKSGLPQLVKEAVARLDVDQFRTYVSPKDISIVQQLLKDDKGLAGRVKEIKEVNITGGVIAESMDGNASIDNTYETRLEMLLPQILPEIGRELFATA